MNTRVNSSTAPVLDIRGLPAPDNILQVLNKVSELRSAPDGTVLELKSDVNPMQLYDLLQQRGFFLDMTPQADGSYVGIVRSRDITPSH